MSDPASGPFRAERHEIGMTRNGRPLAVEPIDPMTLVELATAIAQIGPWAHYGRTPADMASSLARTGDSVARYQLCCGDVIAGAVMIQRDWLVGPYLRLLAILPAYQSAGAGARVLAWYEAEARAHRQRNIWLCVSGFNVGAIAFYARHGFDKVGVLDSLLRRGDDEVLMRKQLEG
jgi:ribosomal protein S18 acetylase RimI-like enzyme